MSWREGFGPGFEKIVWQALKVEQVSVAIKKYKHKSYEGPEMVKKKIAPLLRARPGNSASLCQRALSCFTNKEDPLTRRGVVRGDNPKFVAA